MSTFILFGACGMNKKESDYVIQKYLTLENGIYSGTLNISMTEPVCTWYYVVNGEILNFC
jgi:hypothetical protein